MVVHDIDPAISGVLAHLFHVALKTPVFKSQIKSNLEVLVLGDFDLNSPLAADVISENIEIQQFENHEHLSKTVGVVSLTGCDLDLLSNTGLINEAVPVIALSKFAKRAFLGSLKSKDAFFKEFGVNAADVGKIYESDRHLTQSRISESIFLADCVFSCCNLIVQSESV